MIALQSCAALCQTLTWTGRRYTQVPSVLKLPPTSPLTPSSPQVYYRAPGSAPWLTWNHFSCDVETLHWCVSGVVPRPGIEPVSSALAECSLHLWSIREVPWNSAILDHGRLACKLMSPGFNKCSDVLCFWPAGPSQCVPVFSPEMLHFLTCKREIWLAGQASAFEGETWMSGCRNFRQLSLFFNSGFGLEK